MNWNRLLSSRRMGGQGRTKKNDRDLRSDFEKDYHRIIGSSAFRRLQDKTQVFALDKSDFIRTRLTHSLEVSSFAKSLGQNIAQYIIEKHLDPEFTLQTKADICDILQCAGLIHDIGNPPFGHFGEEAIRDWFVRRMSVLCFDGRPLTEVLHPQMLADLYHFEGNAQALRQVAKLHIMEDGNGMDLTFALLSSIIKYPVSSLGMNPGSGDIRMSKPGYFYAERELFSRILEETGTEGARHPLSFILEAADDIAYRTADIEDAFKKGFISFEKLREELTLARNRAGRSDAVIDPAALLDQQLESARSRQLDDPKFFAVQNMLRKVQSALIYCATCGFTYNYRQIMDGTYKSDLLKGTCGDWVSRALGDIAYRYAFNSRQILQMEVAAGTILDSLLDRLVPAVLYYDCGRELKLMDGKLINMISRNYRQVYHIYGDKAKSAEEKLYLRLLLVTDFVSGMTDSYARDLYQRLNGII